MLLLLLAATYLAAAVTAHPTTIGLFVAVAVVMLIRLAYLSGAFERRVHRCPDGQCPRCAYDLRHHSQDGCPECGWQRASEA